MEIIYCPDYSAMSKQASEVVAKSIKSNPRLVLGLATGSTPEGLYAELINKFEAGEIDFHDITSFNLDEYVGLSSDNRQSYHYYMAYRLFDHINIEKSKAHIPDGTTVDLNKECEDYEIAIAAAGGIDLQILGLGLDGHIGFNEPGTSFSSRTHVAELAKSTIEANSRFFNDIAEVPTSAITMGLETIMQAKSIVLVVSGISKADILTRVLYGPISTAVPASILQNHPDVTLITDIELSE